MESQLRHFPIEKGTSVMPPGYLTSPRSRQTGSRTTLKSAYIRSRLIMSFNAECPSERPTPRRHERGCRPFSSTGNRGVDQAFPNGNLE